MNKIMLALCTLAAFLASCSSGDPQAQKPLLIVDRTDPLHNLADAPFHAVISDAEEIDKLMDRIKQLPSFPKEIVHCPMDIGVSYMLTFKNIDGRNQEAIITATGCQQVKMDGKVYWAMEPKGNGFRAYFMQVLGMTEQQFDGIMKSG
ncbi:hypothetical protein [Paenibacillus sp. OV219]|uniref:hypothetical protein n=1 Tax=Paenibacillus sp. OV219 TaxID=1884377 RepID=UPI0008C2F462|nr:hypothetical protein [Paenibacillus sp. OV219]SEN76839.1 hypothetical protein SAMN05518847_10493 [Paenibacillus sp. OV219]